jgi:hypothetical protein
LRPSSVTTSGRCRRESEAAEEEAGAGLGGWLYESYSYVIQHGTAVDAKITSTFVPDLRPDRFEGAVDAVLDDLRGRRGFRQTWEGIAPDTRAEIRSALLSKIKELA